MPIRCNTKSLENGKCIQGVENALKEKPMQPPVVLPETPEGFYVQTTVISAGTSTGNVELAEIVRNGGRVVSIIPLLEPPNAIKWESKALVVYFSRLKPEDMSN
jgi:hypothetical protein